jgi:hypothetical protein
MKRRNLYVAKAVKILDRQYKSRTTLAPYEIEEGFPPLSRQQAIRIHDVVQDSRLDHATKVRRIASVIQKGYY